MDKIDFLIQETDDVWIRDHGPIFVKDSKGNLCLTHWKFNGWGNKYPFENDAKIPIKISENGSIPLFRTSVCLEGGGIEVNGAGTLLAAKSSILNDNRNPTLRQEEIESDGKPFQLIPVPVTKRVVKEAGSKGSYLNFYIGNEVVLVPIYGDEHDRWDCEWWHDSLRNATTTKVNKPCITGVNRLGTS